MRSSPTKTDERTAGRPSVSPLRLAVSWASYEVATAALGLAAPFRAGRAIDTTSGPEKFERKIAVGKQWTSVMHRSGWQYAMEALAPLDAPNGLLFDGFLEETFDWHAERSLRTGKIPYAVPWAGFLHRPPNAPDWYPKNRSPEALLASDAWKRSEESCLGLFCLSEYMASWLRERVSVPVCALVHPTEIPSVRFSIEEFGNNPRPAIVQIGFSYRKLQSFFELDAGRFRKFMVSPPTWIRRHREEIANVGCGESHGTVVPLPYRTKRSYDRLLSRNVAFLNLYDSSANNALIECIVRGTPVLVNPLPAVREYLGDEYPLYFESLEEAADKLRSDGALAEAHGYLAALPKERFGQEHFRRTFASSEVYRALPKVP